MSQEPFLVQVSPLWRRQGMHTDTHGQSVTHTCHEGDENI